MSDGLKPMRLDKIVDHGTVIEVRLHESHAANKPSKDELAGMCWWNALSERDRGQWLKRAESAVPADAWESFKRVAQEGRKND